MIKSIHIKRLIPSFNHFSVFILIVAGIWYIDNIQRESKMILECVKAMTYRTAINNQYIEGDGGHYLGYELRTLRNGRTYVYASAQSIVDSDELLNSTEHYKLADHYLMRCTVVEVKPDIFNYIEKLSPEYVWVPVSHKLPLDEIISRMSK